MRLEAHKNVEGFSDLHSIQVGWLSGRHGLEPHVQGHAGLVRPGGQGLLAVALVVDHAAEGLPVVLRLAGVRQRLTVLHVLHLAGIVLVVELPGKRGSGSTSFSDAANL